jgi:ATP-dependent exoDNAse (exonuclease V) alpha subunit
VPYSEAIKTLRQNPDKGFDQLEAQGAIKPVSDLERPAAVAQARREAEKTGATIIVCPTHAEIASVTAAIRDDRRVHEELGEEQTFTRLEPLNFTLAEKRDFRNYEPGMRLLFHRPTVDAKRHEIFEILSVKDNACLVRGQDGNETEVTQKQAKSFGVFAAREIQIAPGDRIMLLQNRRSPELRATNGEIADVKQIDAEGRIELEDGRKLGNGYQCFTYGYAQTAHKSQGKTFPNVIVSGNEMDRRGFYVATSRGSETIQVFTDNIEALRDSIGVSGTRQSATELAARAMADGVAQANREMWWIDYETGERTQDATRAAPQSGHSSRSEREGRHYEWEHVR